MKNVHLTLSDDQEQRAESVKREHDLTWKELLMAGVEHYEGD